MLGCPIFWPLWKEAEAYDWDSVEILRQGHDVMEGGHPYESFSYESFSEDERVSDRRDRRDDRNVER